MTDGSNASVIPFPGEDDARSTKRINPASREEIVRMAEAIVFASAGQRKAAGGAPARRHRSGGNDA
jgi:hypothetical protein